MTRTDDDQHTRLAGPAVPEARPPRAWLRPAAIGLAGAVGAAVVLFGGLAVARAGEALPGTTLEGADVSGLGEQDLRAVIDDLVAARRDAEVQVEVAGQQFTFSPGEEGYGVDTDATVQAVVSAGRWGPLGLGGHVSATFGDERSVTLTERAVEDTVRTFVQQVVDQVDQQVHPGSVRVNAETLEIETTAPRDGVEVDVDGSVDAVLDVVGDPDPPVVQLPATVTPPPTDDAALRDAVTRVEEAISQDLVLTANGGSTTLTPTEIATVLRTEERDGRLRIVADQEALANVLSEDLPRLEVEPRDAAFRPVSGFTTFDAQGAATWTPRPAEVEIEPSTPGARYNPEQAAEQVGGLLDNGVHEAELELEVVPADLTTEQAENLNIDHLIGTFTTYHRCCQNRVRNIQRMADIVRGAVLRPGEEFSINDHVGKRTIAKGFVADGVIFNGEIRDEVGGGVSQFATTMYNASFFAGIEILQWQAHSLYISRYPLGREATLNYGTIDLRIANDTSNGIYIHTSYTGESITVSLFGNNGGRTVRATSGSPYDYRGFDTRRRSTSDLYRGEERVVQSGSQGYKVTIERIIEGGGKNETETITTVYSPQPRIIEVGTADPPPEPEPTETESPTEEQTTEGNNGGGGSGGDGGEDGNP